MTAFAGASTRRSVLEAATATLAAAGIASARVDAEWLLAGVLGLARFDAGFGADRQLPEVLTARFAAAVQRRAGREPLQRVVGWEAFRGLRIQLTDDALVPRPETEMLVEWALELLPRPEPGRRPRAVDLGTGSGCIACALAAERGDADVVAVDLSPPAAAVARANAAALGLSSRVRVLVGDLLEPLGAARADLIVSNPPYLPRALLDGLEPEVRDHEPRMALDGGPDGLSLIRRIAAAARRVLAPGAPLVLETAGPDQASEAARHLRAARFEDIAVRSDLAGVARFVAGRA